MVIFCFELLTLISILTPIYTYAIYPIILSLLKSKKYDMDNCDWPKISLLIIADCDSCLAEEKANSVINLDYPIELMEVISSAETNLTIAKKVGVMKKIGQGQLTR